MIHESIHDPIHERVGHAFAFAIVAMTAACSSSLDNGSGPASDAGNTPDTGSVDATMFGGDGGADGRASIGADGASDAGGALDSSAASGDAALPTCITPATPQACSAPAVTLLPDGGADPLSVLPLCTLSETGCMDATNPTAFAANAIYYEVNSPLWSDGAAKMRAFVLPDGGAIHVKNCDPDASAADLAECASPAGRAGPADTGRWVFPVGTVMIKNFLFNDKLVETRLLMRVDAATAAVIDNGTDWVGYNYAWDEAQTVATVVPNERLTVTFDAGAAPDGGVVIVSWNYPSFSDCVTCHNSVVGAIGPENDQMNRIVDGGNQIATLVAKGLFDDTAPTPASYGTPMVEPYANPALGLTGPADAGVVTAARSYVGANCGFCHRPDVNDLGFDLRYALTFAQVGICGREPQEAIPGMTSVNYLDFAPGDAGGSALYVRMSIPAPPSNPADVGRMPPIASVAVDTQALALIGDWINSTTSCPSEDGGSP